MSNRELRLQLWNENPHCYWCGKETLLIDLNNKRVKKQQWKDAATLDHLYTKYELDKRKSEGNPIVLACQECNHRRGAESTKAQPIEELWRRAGQLERMIQEGRLTKPSESDTISA